MRILDRLLGFLLFVHLNSIWVFLVKLFTSIWKLVSLVIQDKKAFGEVETSLSY